MANQRRGKRRYKVAFLMLLLLLFLATLFSSVNKLMALPEAPSIRPITNQLNESLPDIDNIRNLLVRLNQEPLGPRITKLAIPQGKAIMEAGGQTFTLTPNGNNFIQVEPDGLSKASHNDLVNQLLLPTQPIREYYAVYEGKIEVKGIFDTQVLTPQGNNFSDKFAGSDPKVLNTPLDPHPGDPQSPLAPIGIAVGDPTFSPLPAVDPILPEKNKEARSQA